MKLARRIPNIATAAMFVALFAELFATAGCSGYRQYGRSDRTPLPVASAGWDDVIEVGKSVRVRTTRGPVVAGTVESVGPSEIRVSGEPIRFSEIESLQVRSFLWEPTAAVVSVVAWTFWLVTRSAGEFSPDAK